ncbi:DUF58 domain-containing protein [Kineococcus sp. SYSU DK001]|uniref:DUF58 domain-containing protein n=1 Tax=Kineococcus sp. SYSU DK001 TaxID=3383122 RepID=UPI003D7D84F8
MSTPPPGRSRSLARPTARGWVFALVGVVAVVGGAALGQRDLLRIGVLVLVLVAVAAWSTTRAVRTLDLVSRSKDELVEAGATSPVRLHLAASGRAGVRLVVEDPAPLALGGTARLAVPRVHEGDTFDLEYKVRAEVRGSYALGPARLVALDVFGLVRAHRVVGTAVTLDVLPRVHPLSEVTLGELGGARGSSASASAAAAPDDVSIREYRVGDDLRRVHWRSTARRGAVMVRSDEHPGRPDVVVLLDTRAQAHAGRGAGSSLEWGISAAASAAAHLQRRRHRVRLLHDGAYDPPRELDEVSAVRGLMRSLARLRPGGADGLARSTAELGRAESTLLVAVLGRVDEDDVAPLLAARPLGVPALAVLLRTADWAGADDPSPGLERARLVLARAGWRTAVAGAHDDVPDVWARLTRPGARGDHLSTPPPAPSSQEVTP